MLHFQKKDDSAKDGGGGANGQDGPQSNQIQKSDGEQTLSTVSKSDSQVALRTVPVVLSDGKNKLVVNALLDDGRNDISKCIALVFRHVNKHKYRFVLLILLPCIVMNGPA